MVPAAGGPKSPSREKSKRTPLPDEGKKALEEARPEVAKPLEEISSSTTYGAPEAVAPKARPKRDKPPLQQGPFRDFDKPAPGTSIDSTLRGTANAIATATVTDARLIGLLVALIGTTMGAVGVAVRQARTAGRELNSRLA